MRSPRSPPVPHQNPQTETESAADDVPKKIEGIGLPAGNECLACFARNGVEAHERGNRCDPSSLAVTEAPAQQHRERAIQNRVHPISGTDQPLCRRRELTQGIKGPRNPEKPCKQKHIDNCDNAGRRQTSHRTEPIKRETQENWLVGAIGQGNVHPQW